MNKYNYKRFQSGYYYSSKGFYGPKPGEKAPNFTAYTTDGEEVRLSDFFGKPIVLEMGSVTCPVYAGIVPKMKELTERFSDVQFFVLYVREAHPGERRGPHQSLEEKTERANECINFYGENRDILIDDLEGTAHTQYGFFPNSVYLIDADGKVFWRAKWNHPRDLAKNIERLQNERESLPEFTKEFPGGADFSALLKGGKLAVWDFVKELPKTLWSKFIRRND